MNPQEQEQFFLLLQNIEENRKKIPTFYDLTHHPIFWPHFATMSEQEVTTVKKSIDEYIEKKVYTFTKTKGWQLFIRFFEAYNDLFRKFRALNESDEIAKTEAFQHIGKQVENELFKLEGILTERMLNQEKGLDQVVGSFYNIVYLFFPRYNFIS